MKPNMAILDEMTAYTRIVEFERKALNDATLERGNEGFYTHTYAQDGQETRLEGYGKTPMEAMTALARAVREFYQGDYSFAESYTKGLTGIDAGWDEILKGKKYD